MWVPPKQGLERFLMHAAYLLSKKRLFLNYVRNASTDKISGKLKGQ